MKRLLKFRWRFLDERKDSRDGVKETQGVPKLEKDGVSAPFLDGRLEHGVIRLERAVVEVVALHQGRTTSHQ